MRKSLDSDVLEAAMGRIVRATRKSGPRPPIRPQPVHTLVVPAERFHHEAIDKAGALALRLLRSHAPDSIVLGRTLRLPGWERLPTDPVRADELLWRLESGGGNGAAPEARAAHEVYERVVRRLEHAPVQDLRIDLHEGFSRPPDDDDALATAGAIGEEIARGAEQGSLPPRIGIWLPSLDARTGERALAMLDCTVSTLVDRIGADPPALVVGFANLSLPAQVTAAVHVAATLEQRLSLRRGTLQLELLVSTADAVLDEEGRVRIPALLAAAAGRCVGVHVDDARIARATGAGERGAVQVVRDLVRLCAGEVPVAWGEGPTAHDPHDGAAVVSSWSASAERVFRSASDGVFWGFDRDPGQLPARLAATFSALRTRQPALRDALADAIHRSRSDHPVASDADGQRHLDRLLQAADCGACDLAELAPAGVDVGDLADGSFRGLVEKRRA